jgi:hypothetical protein
VSVNEKAARRSASVMSAGGRWGGLDGEGAGERRAAGRSLAGGEAGGAGDEDAAEEPEEESELQAANECSVWQLAELTVSADAVDDAWERSGWRTAARTWAVRREAGRSFQSAAGTNERSEAFTTNRVVAC